MRLITALLLWTLAIILAIVILRRVRRGKPTVLTGRWSPRVIRMIVVVLVVLGMGEEASTPNASAAPLKLPIRSEDDKLPATFTTYMLDGWISINQEGNYYEPARKWLLRGLAGEELNANELKGAQQLVLYHSPAMQKILNRDLQAVREKKPMPATTADELKLSLDELEKHGRFDHMLNAYLWRKTEAVAFKDAAARMELFSRFHRHARITDALIRMHSQMKPFLMQPRAWMSKAGPREGDRAAMQAFHAKLADMHKTVAELLPSTDEGTWKRDGVAKFKPTAGDVILIRAKNERKLEAGAFERFGRLDLLKTGEQPAEIEIDGLGKVPLPANKLLSVWDLPALLPEAVQKKLAETVQDALKNNSMDAADKLEKCLAISHESIRVGLKELPKEKGSPRMRLILSLFDDNPMPLLPIYQPKPDPRVPAGGPGVDPPGAGPRGSGKR